MNPNWSIGLSLIVMTIAIHTAGVVMMASVVMRARVVADGRPPRNPLRVSLFVMGMVGGVGLILAVMYALEAVLWAVAYVWITAFGTFPDALLYSMGTMTTLDMAGLALPSQWQMISALEAVDGVLLFGISTAFLFTVMQQLWPMLSHHLPAKQLD